MYKYLWTKRLSYINSHLINGNISEGSRPKLLTIEKGVGIFERTLMIQLFLLQNIYAQIGEYTGLSLPGKIKLPGDIIREILSDILLYVGNDELVSSKEPQAVLFLRWMVIFYMYPWRFRNSPYFSFIFIVIENFLFFYISHLIYFFSLRVFFVFVASVSSGKETLIYYKQTTL